MKCYELTRDFTCPTSSHLHWALERDKPIGNYSPEDGWHPREDTRYENCGNTWFASGRVTEDSKLKLSRLWARVAGVKASLRRSHVLGDYSSGVCEQVIVDRAFVDAVTNISSELFDFWEHKNVWDFLHRCPPWDGPFYFATVLQTVQTFDPNTTSMYMREDIQAKYRGAYSLGTVRPIVKASTIAGHLVWRDRLTRRVLCTEPFCEVLNTLGVVEWQTRPVEVWNDLS